MKRYSLNIPWPAILTILLLAGLATEVLAGKPACWVATWQKYERVDDGRKHLCHGGTYHYPGWDNVQCAASIMGHIQTAGIEVVLPDLTNYDPVENPVGSARQWLGTVYCFNEARRRDMTMAVILDGRSHTSGTAVTLCPISDINSQAKRVWEDFAAPVKQPGYEHYKGKPLLIIFNWTFNIDGRKAVWRDFYDQAPPEDKTYLEKFTIELSSSDRGLSPANAPWGWHNPVTASGSNDQIRFCTHNENGGTEASTFATVPITAEEFRTRVEWCKAATDYSIYGSYGLDNPWGQGWGIQDDDTCSFGPSLYPGDDPYIYYNVVSSVVADTTVSADEHILPANLSLHQNYPNPFSRETTISYYLRRPGRLSLGIYNITGQTICNLVSGYQSAGLHSVTWDGKDFRGRVVSKGLYFYDLRIGKLWASGRMIYLKP